MATIFYPAIIERAEEGYSVFFPDLPGCTSAGRTVQEAALNAKEALDGHIIVSIEHGDTLPDPGNIETIEHDPDVEEVARLLVPGERPGQAVRINIMVDDGLVAAIDRVARNRSRFFADAARVALAARN
jgi:predicted RNase H-like HicB family nuclease